MAQLIHDSFAGRLLRHLSGGKLFPFEEDKNPSLLKQFSIETGPSTEKMSPDAGRNAESAEEGNDAHLVGWYGPDDPEVRPPNRLFIKRKSDRPLEPAELVHFHQDRGHFSVVFPNVRRLCWLLNLYGRDPGSHEDLSCEPGRRYHWPHRFRPRLWTW